MPKINTKDWETYDEDNYVNYQKIRKSIKKDEKNEEKTKNSTKKSSFSKKWLPLFQGAKYCSGVCFSLNYDTSVT